MGLSLDVKKNTPLKYTSMASHCSSVNSLSHSNSNLKLGEIKPTLQKSKSMKLQISCTPLPISSETTDRSRNGENKWTDDTARSMPVTDEKAPLNKPQKAIPQKKEQKAKSAVSRNANQKQFNSTQKNVKSGAKEIATKTMRPMEKSKAKEIKTNVNSIEIGKIMSKACEQINQKYFTPAIGTLRKILKLNPKSSEAYCQIGYCYNELKNYPQALVSFDQSIALKDSPFTHYFKGITYFKIKEYSQSIASFDKAIILKSDDADYFFSRADSKKKLKLYEEAIEDYTYAYMLDYQLVKV
jgi:tetratricopeptide (TPR) repeat protein